MISAKDLYESLVHSIDSACASENFQEVCNLAIQMGMTGGEINSFNALRYEFSYLDDEGEIVTLSFRSYDPSGPFQNELDINRFTAKLLSGTREVESYDRQYSD